MSWTQPRPDTSLTLIDALQLDKNEPIIDVGGGESRLVDYLLQEGFTDITVLDISQRAIDRAKARLGPLSDRVTWIVINVLDFIPSRAYRVWHDRATFHFLTGKHDIEKYVGIVEKSVIGGDLILGTFSMDGPVKCSGLPVKQYDRSSIQQLHRSSKKLGRFTEIQRVKCWMMALHIFEKRSGMYVSPPLGLAYDQLTVGAGRK